MRLAWVLYGGLDQRTGGTIYDAEVVAGLRRAGDEVEVLSLTAPASGHALARRLRELAPEVVVGDELCFRELAVAFSILRDAGDPPLRVLLVHHLTAWETELPAPTRQALRAEEQQAIDASDRVVTTSHTTRDRLADEGPTPSIRVVLPGADRLERPTSRERDKKGAVRFVFVGSLVARKRVLELVRAFCEGAHEHGTLALVGSTTRDASYARDVARLVEERNVGDRVTLSGEVDEAEVARAIAAADVFVMPSSLEGYGIAATEAMYAGVPVIAARTPGLEEALASCNDGALFVANESELAAALSRFASDASLRDRMTRAARAAALLLPTWSQCAIAFRAALLK